MLVLVVVVVAEEEEVEEVEEEEVVVVAVAVAVVAEAAEAVAGVAEEEEEEDFDFEEDLGERIVAFQWFQVGGLLRHDTLASFRAARSMTSACFCCKYILEIRHDKSRLNI